MRKISVIRHVERWDGEGGVVGKEAHEPTTQIAGKETEHDEYLLDSLHNAHFMTHLWDTPVAGKRRNYEPWSAQTCFKGRAHEFHPSRVEPEAFLGAKCSPYFRPATQTWRMKWARYVARFEYKWTITVNRDT